MRAIKYRELKRMYDLSGAEKTVRHLQEALEEGHLQAEDFSIREIADATLGAERVRQLDPRNSGATLLEASEGVDVTAFSNITGQVIRSKILEAYAQEAFVVSKLVDTIPTRLDGERIPGIGRISDEVAEVGPGMPYPNLGFGEDYIETPQTSKHGFIVPVTKEAIFFDRTHLILQRAAEVGEVLGLNKEKRLIDLLIGVTNNYKWKDVEYNTYSTTGSGVAPDGSWVNQTDQELVDWTDVDAAEQLFADILDPNTGEPVLIQATTVLVMPAYRHAAHRVFNAAEITYTSTGDNIATTAANPLGNYRVVESRLAYRRVIASGVAAAEAKKWWFIGDLRKAFAYMENWPITVTQSPALSEAEFNQDIVVRFKASERGAAAVINPRYVVKSTGAA
ncbi:MAG: phage major capsid protein [Thermoguttaceae bacterium]